MDGKQSSFVERITRGFCTAGGTVRRKLFLPHSLQCKADQ